MQITIASRNSYDKANRMANLRHWLIRSNRLAPKFCPTIGIMDIPNAMGRLRVIYPYLMKLDYDNCRTRSAGQLEDLRAAEEKTPLELFSTLFSMQNGRDMSEQQTAYLQQMIDTIWEEAL